MGAPEGLTELAGPRLRLLYELACAFAAHLELDDLVTLVVEKCREAFAAEGASVLLHDRDTDELYFPFVVSDDPEVAAELSRLRFPAREGIAGSVLESGQPARVDDAANDPRVFRGADQRTRTTTRSMLCAPLVTREGTIGVLQVVNHRGSAPFPADDLPFLETLASSVAVAIENARLYAALRDSESRLKVEVGELRRDLARQDRFAEIVGTSAPMAEVFRLMESAAATPITVLIEGETGTGKELVARGIHKAGARAKHPFIAINCAALPETLLESELFGYRRGAFTGATQDHMGLFEAARGGTILLDEVGEMPAVMQAKLLRVLQEGEIVPVGDTRPRRVDVRVISATNRDLATQVEQQVFRQDLYYRLCTFPIRLPPLRERREDIAPITARLIEKVAASYGKRLAGLTPAAVRVLEGYAWPGNIRELQNEIERAAALVQDGEPIAPEHLSPRLAGSGGFPPAQPSAAGRVHPVASEAGEVRSSGEASQPAPASLREARAAFEVDFIREALSAEKGNVTRAARALGLSRVAVQKKMKEYGLR